MHSVAKSPLLPVGQRYGNLINVNLQQFSCSVLQVRKTTSTVVEKYERQQRCIFFAIVKGRKIPPEGIA
jgi:hypothetical protein